MRVAVIIFYVLIGIGYGHSMNTREATTSERIFGTVAWPLALGALLEESTRK